MQIARVTHIYPPLTGSDLKEELYSIRTSWSRK